MLLIVRFWERSDRTSIGLSNTSLDDVFAAIAVWLLFDFCQMVFLEHKDAFAATGWIDIRPAELGIYSEGFFLTFIASDVIFEEIATRSYIIERIETFTGRAYLGAAASLFVSVALHVPGRDLHQALLRAPMLATLTGLYLWRRNAMACALTHFLLDAQFYLMLFNVHFLLPWIYKPPHTAILLAGEGLIYCAVRWRRRSMRNAGELLPATSE
jgi:membrane protease YdiL (CAAX protease family)